MVFYIVQGIPLSGIGLFPSVHFLLLSPAVSLQYSLWQFFTGQQSFPSKKPFLLVSQYFYIKTPTKINHQKSPHFPCTPSWVSTAVRKCHLFSMHIFPLDICKQLSQYLFVHFIIFHLQKIIFLYSNVSSSVFCFWETHLHLIRRFRSPGSSKSVDNMFISYYHDSWHFYFFNFYSLDWLPILPPTPFISQCILSLPSLPSLLVIWIFFIPNMLNLLHFPNPYLAFHLYFYFCFLLH